MEVIRSWQERGVTVPKPYERHLKVVLAPDRRNVPEITFSFVYVYPQSRTDMHAHDRPELIIITSGRGKSVCDGREVDIEQDMALWVLPGERHQVINTGDDMLKLATVFVPAYRAENLLSGIFAAAEAAKGEK
jgi:mannose-6-phosphate isomerase-like protein (cupin superfamily)